MIEATWWPGLAALEGIGEMPREAADNSAARETTGERTSGHGLESGGGSKDKGRDAPAPEHEHGRRVVNARGGRVETMNAGPCRTMRVANAFAAFTVDRPPPRPL